MRNWKTSLCMLPIALDGERFTNVRSITRLSRAAMSVHRSAMPPFDEYVSRYRWAEVVALGLIASMLAQIIQFFG